MMESIIGLDIGTTGCKATLFDRDGAVRHQAYREYPVGAYTGSISADMIWEQVQQVIRACTAQTPEIAAICATSFGEVVVPVDAAGHTLAEAMLYTNAAAQAQWKRLDEKLGGKRIHMITGHVSHSMYTISNLMRIRETEPEVYAKTAKFLFISSFINYRLTGVAATETSLAARSMAYDVCSGVWSSEIFAAADENTRKTLLYRVSQHVYDGSFIPPESGNFISDQNLFNYQAKVLRELLNDESYICVGRAADFVLKDKPNVLTVYIDAPYEDRIDREMKRQGIGRSQAIRYIE